MFSTGDVVAGIALPAVLCGALYAVAWRLWVRPAGHREARWGPAVAVGAAFVAGYLALEGWPGLPPLEASGWLPFTALAAMAVGVARARNVPVTAEAVLRSLLCLAVPLLTLRPMVEYTWSPGTATVWIGGLAAALLAIGYGVDSLASRTPGLLVPSALGATSTATAVCVVIAGSARLLQMTAVLAAALGAAIVVSLIRRRANHDGGSTVTLVLLGALLINAFFYLEDLPASAAVLLALAPLAAWAGGLSRGARRWPWGLAAVLLPLAVAVARTIAVMPDDPYGY